MNLVVAAGLGALATRLGAYLADRPPSTEVADVFGTEVVAVPSAGVESWLVSRLAAGPPDVRSGAPVVAGVDFVFPSALMARALGRGVGTPLWPTIGQLTWAVHAALAEHDDLAQSFATQPGVSPLRRARSLADLLDRYLLHRPAMVQEWEQRGAPSAADPAHHQAELWLAVVDRLGTLVATEQRQAIDALAAGRSEPELPSRLALFGASSLPTLHREVVAALGRQREVVLFTPAVSLAARQQVVAADDPSVALAEVGHRLVRAWGQGNLEDHVVLAGIADHLEVVAEDDGAADAAASRLLAHLRMAVRAGVDPRQTPPRPLDPDDDSVRWHRCYGPARQAEVVADAVRHLLEPTEGGGDLEFRDIVILCPDVPTFAPLVQAAFAGRDDVAEVPLAVTDRSLVATTPLVEVTAALLGLLDGRFRPADLLAFAGRAPVARRFGLSPSDLADLGELVASVNVAWGIDPVGRAEYLEDHGGLRIDAPLGSRTWVEGFAQLVAGAALADRPVHAAAGLPTVPLSGLESPETVATVGAFVSLVDVVSAAVRDLAATQSPRHWIDRLGAALDELVALGDDDAWQWRRLEDALQSFAEDAAAFEAEVAGDELAALLSEQLGGVAGRARFGSGAVTLTSLTGLRAVPHRVVILLGLDGDLGVTGGRADDLLSVDRRAGEPQPLRELRAQLLDAVLAAQERLVLVSTATDPRSNKEVAPAVPLAELLAVIDDTATVTDGGAASAAVAVHHPRHGWSTPNFMGGGDAVVPGRRWGFDAAALAAARLRELDHRGTDGDADASWTRWAPLGDDPGLVPTTGVVGLGALALALRNPTRAFLADRLGVRLPDDGAPTHDGLVDLQPDGLDRYHLMDDLWSVIGPGSDVVAPPSGGETVDDAMVADLVGAWRTAQCARGALPPAPFVDATFAGVHELVMAFRAAVGDVLGTRVATRVALTVELSSGVVVTGDAVVVRDGDTSVVLDARLARRKTSDRLDGLLTLAAVAAQFPDESWTLHQLRRASGKAGVDAAVVTLRPDPDAAAGIAVLEWAVDYRDHALAGFFPALPATLAAVWTGLRDPAGPTLGPAMSAWGESEAEVSAFSSGDRTDQWVAMPGETPEFDDLWSLAPTPIEADWAAGSPDAPGSDRRLGVWAERLWGRAQQFAEGLEP